MSRLSDFARKAKAFIGAGTSNEVYEPQVSRVIRTIVKKGWSCADVGANVGKLTFLLTDLVGSEGHVFAFEAHPQNAEMLQQEAQRRKTQNITVENLAVTDSVQDQVWIFAGRGKRSEEWNIVGHDVDGNPTDRELQIRAASLDSYFSADIPLHFVKIDVEGAESRVLQGMRRILRHQRPIVLVEFHNEEGWSGRTELFDAGYHMFDLKLQMIDSRTHIDRIYQCLFLPDEASQP